MSEQYETANIVYKGLTDGKLTVTLLDEKKGKWTIWKKAYQSEDDSEPYQALGDFKFGDTFGVSYKETDEMFVNKQKKTINFKKRTIYSIMPPIAKPSNEVKPKQNEYKPTKEQEPTDWDKIAVGKCQTVFLQAYIQSGKTLQEAKLQVVEARKLAELVVYGHQQNKFDTHNILTHEQGMQIDEAPLPEEPNF